MLCLWMSLFAFGVFVSSVWGVTFYRESFIIFLCQSSMIVSSLSHMHLVIHDYASSLNWLLAQICYPYMRLTCLLVCLGPVGKLGISEKGIGLVSTFFIIGKLQYLWLGGLWQHLYTLRLIKWNIPKWEDPTPILIKTEKTSTVTHNEFKV